MFKTINLCLKSLIQRKVPFDIGRDRTRTQNNFCQYLIRHKSLTHLLVQSESISHVLLEWSDNSKQLIFFGGSSGFITGSVKPISLNPILGISTCLLKEFWCPSSKGTVVPFSAIILREPRENVFSLTLSPFLKRSIYFSK